MEILKVENLTKTYGSGENLVHAVDDVSFSVEKGEFVLCRTSNKGGDDFQMLDIGGVPLYIKVAEKVAEWDINGQMGLVIGATYPEELKKARATVLSSHSWFPASEPKAATLTQL